MKTKLSIELTESTSNRIQRLRESIGVGTDAEIFQQALKLLEFVVIKVADGSTLYLESPDGEREVIAEGLLPN